jgi:hypothetical protein
MEFRFRLITDLYFPMSDYVFFKFRAINKYPIDGLVKSTIYFASPKDLNDPFDCRVDIKKAAERACTQLSGEKKRILTRLAGMERYLDQIQKDTADVALCSFSLVLEEPLLWAHYANQHKGLCLTYTFPESFLNNPDSILAVKKVEYEDDAMTNWFVQNTPTQETDFHEFTLGIVKKILSVKSPVWGYEKEARVIRVSNGPFQIERDHFKQICFGLDTPDADIDLMRTLVDKSGYNVQFCKIERSQSDFGIEARDI